MTADRVTLDPDGSVDDMHYEGVNIHFEMLDESLACLGLWRDEHVAVFNVFVEDGRLVIREQR